MSWPAKPLDGKIALVTGAAGGIGSAITRAYAAAGARVAVHYHSRGSAAEMLAKQVEEAGGRAIVVSADLGDPASLKALYARVRSELGAPDVLVNNAGLSMNALMAMTPESELRRILEVNLMSVMLLTKAFVRDRLRAKQPGVVVNLTSVAGLAGSVGMVAYGAAKAGVASVTRSLARELAPSGIRVNAIAPGPIETDMMSELTEAQRALALAQVPMARVGTPEEVAAVAVFLASELASFVTGEIIRVDGGLLA